MSSAPTTIILLGGGYVSVCAYRSLAKQLGAQLRDGRVTIKVICPDTHHVFHGWTAEVLTGILRQENQLSSLAHIMPHAEHVRGTVTAVDLTAKCVQVTMTEPDETTQFSYDHLLIGIGSVDTVTLDGIAQYGYQLKSRQAFQRTKEAIPALVRRAAHDSLNAQRLLTFTVAGGGFTGVEVACNLAEYVAVLMRQYPSLAHLRPRIQLIHSGERVLPDLQGTYNQLIAYAEKIMANYGITRLSKTRVTQVTSEGAVLSDGSFLASSMVISTIGQLRPLLPGTEGISRDSMQRLYTNQYQQISGHSTVWGGGDACNVTHYYSREACPTNALWAIKHGEFVGRNIARAIRGKALKPFTYSGLGQSASLGMGKGITELYGLQFTGGLAWLMRWFFFHYFMPSRRVMVQGIGNWFSLAFSRRRAGLTSGHNSQETPTPTSVAPSLLLREDYVQKPGLNPFSFRDETV